MESFGGSGKKMITRSEGLVEDMFGQQQGRRSFKEKLRILVRKADMTFF